MTHPESPTLPADGPRTPDEDETFGREPDDPRLAGSFDTPYEVTQYDPANELMDICDRNGHTNGGS